MQFNSWTFLIVFLPVVIVTYFGLNKYYNRKCATWCLILSNLVFYGYGGLECVLYLIACAIINFVAFLFLYALPIFYKSFSEKMPFPAQSFQHNIYLCRKLPTCLQNSPPNYSIQF